jgi:hypothetical protein
MRSKLGTPSSPQHTASPSMTQERAQAGERLHDQRETVGQVVAGAAVEPHSLAVLAGDDAEAVVLDLVQPRVAGRRLLRRGGQARRDEAGREGHAPPIERGRGARQTMALGYLDWAAARVAVAIEHVAIALAEPEEAQRILPAYELLRPRP